ncbi:MAG: xanthine phosphoribosyltransferase [Clostridiales bacterium]|nr:xanthine phosphoribosyltransferase [Clostridiales bacterium]MDY2833737.1 xanthine phosphoribosyltransferase [Candidatus Aphodomonas sp.]
MKFMTERIAREGRALNEDVLLVDSFLNHQVDMELMRQCGDAFAEHFRGKGITRVLTVESSGIAPAGMAALALGVPLVFLKKKTSRITAGDVYQTPVQSFTKGTRYELTVASRYLPAGEKVLFIDDFLAMGEAALGVARLVKEAGSEIAGIGIVIEKSFQPGRKKLEAAGFDVFSLARVKTMREGAIEFVEE